MNASNTRRFLLAAAILLLPPFAALGFWMPGTGPCAWMADGLLNGMGTRGYGGVPYYPPPPAYFPPPQYHPSWPAPYPANGQPDTALGDSGSAPVNP